MTKLNKFAAWQEANQQRREVIIKDFLLYLEKTRVRVRNATDLADLVARHIAQTEGAPCNKATLMRNLRYKAKILSYQAKCSGSNSNDRRSRMMGDPSADAVVVTKKLESANLKREIERLNLYIQSLEDKLGRKYDSEGSEVATGCPNEELESGQQSLSDYELKFVRTCQALRAVLIHLNLVLEVDSDAEAIRDRSRRRNNVIVEKEIAGPFFEWLRSVTGAQR